jgi:DNA-binding IclR family transcriptional regulator
LSVAPASPRGAGARLQARAVRSAERGRFQAPGPLREQHLEPRTPNTITDRRRLQAELRLTARRGPSIGDEAILAGVRRCGAAAFDDRGEVRGAIGIAGPTPRPPCSRGRAAWRFAPAAAGAA